MTLALTIINGPYRYVIKIMHFPYHRSAPHSIIIREANAYQIHFHIRQRHHSVFGIDRVRKILTKKVNCQKRNENFKSLTSSQRTTSRRLRTPNVTGSKIGRANEFGASRPEKIWLGHVNYNRPSHFCNTQGTEKSNRKVEFAIFDYNTL